MAELELDQVVLRYCRQIIMQAMDHVRSSMREEDLPAMNCRVVNPHVHKSELRRFSSYSREVKICRDRDAISGNRHASKEWDYAYDRRIGIGAVILRRLLPET